MELKGLRTVTAYYYHYSGKVLILLLFTTITVIMSITTHYFQGNLEMESWQRIQDFASDSISSLHRDKAWHFSVLVRDCRVRGHGAGQRTLSHGKLFGSLGLQGWTVRAALESLD
jgi:hypothetical protein